MQQRTVAQNTIYLTVSYIAQKVLSFGYFVLLARYLGVENIGKYAFALSFTTMWAVFVDIGLTPALIKEVSRSFSETKKQIAAVISIKLILGLVVYGLVVLSINLMGYPSLTKNLVYLSGLIMVLDAITLSLWGVLRGARNLKYEGIGIVGNQFLVIAFGFMFLWFKLPLVYIMLPLLIGSVFNLVFSLIMVKTKLPLSGTYAFDWALVKKMLWLAGPFALLTIFSRVYGNADSVLLSFLLGAQGDFAVGIYAAAMKIPFALQFIPSAFAAAIFPAFSYYYTKDKQQLVYIFEKSFYFLTILVLPIVLGLFVLADQVIPLVFGNEFFLAIVPARILILGLIFIFWNFLLGSLLNGTDHQWQNTLFVGVAMVISIILNYIFIPYFGYLAASVIFPVSQLGVFFASLWVTRRVIAFDQGKLFWQFLRLLLSGLIMAVVVWLLKDYLFVGINIMFGVMVYLLALIVTRSITKKDILDFKNTITNR